MQDHDRHLVLVAALICTLACWTALGLARRSIGTHGRTRLAWLVTAAAVTGCGIWATHFIAMLAFSTGLPTSYDLGLTALSVVIAVLITGVGLGIAVRGGKLGLWSAGAVIGAGVSAMHFTGMAALEVPAAKHWDAALAVSAVLLGVGLGAAAVRVALGGEGKVRTAAGTNLLALSICAMHFTAMGALRLGPTPLLPSPEQPSSSWWLALGVAAATTVILVAATVGVLVDRHLASRAAGEALRLRTLVDATFEGIVIHADGIILDVNASLSDLVGYSREALLGRFALDLVMPEYAEQVRPSLASGDNVAHEVEVVSAAGRRIPVELLGRPIEYGGQRARVVAVRDVSERRRAEERIRHLAHHDALTSLPNRVLFREHMQRALARAWRGDGLAVLCLDLDRFKAVNDTLGHPVGDALLRAVAERLRSCTRDADLIARLGGDEFAIVQESASQPTQATALARRVVEALAVPFDIEGHRIAIGASVGIALADDGLEGADELLKRADLALYRAKADGRGTWAFFEEEMNARMQARRLLELDLRSALAGDQLEVFYQPFVEASRNEVSGFEALVRWRHPERGIVSPGEFIPVAEEIGLIGQIGAWVLRRACADVVAWPGRPKVAVNLSPAQFRNRALEDDVALALSASGLEPSRLELEVTEGLLLADDAGVLATLHKLRAMGVRIAMDDFGTGYSSLSYLRRFPFDKIKIDQSFVRGLGQQEDCTAIVRAVVGLGRSLGIAVNAEGVETQEQLAALRAEGCGEVQGYLFSKPMPAGEVLAALARAKDPRDEHGGARGARSEEALPAA